MAENLSMVVGSTFMAFGTAAAASIIAKETGMFFGVNPLCEQGLYLPGPYHRLIETPQVRWPRSFVTSRSEGGRGTGALRRSLFGAWDLEGRALCWVAMANKVSRLRRIREGAQALWEERGIEAEGERTKLHKFANFWVRVWRSFVRNR